jgi:hypothetical protein
MYLTTIARCHKMGAQHTENTMTKNELIAALEKIEGNPEVRQNLRCSIPLICVVEKPDGDFNGGGVNYTGRWRLDNRYIQIQHGRDEDTMVFM